MSIQSLLLDLCPWTKISISLRICDWLGVCIRSQVKKGIDTEIWKAVELSSASHKNIDGLSENEQFARARLIRRANHFVATFHEKDVKISLFSWNRKIRKSQKMQEPRNCQVWKDELISDHLLKTFIQRLRKRRERNLVRNEIEEVN